MKTSGLVKIISLLALFLPFIALASPKQFQASSLCIPMSDEDSFESALAALGSDNLLISTHPRSIAMPILCCTIWYPCGKPA